MEKALSFLVIGIISILLIGIFAVSLAYADQPEKNADKGNKNSDTSSTSSSDDSDDDSDGSTDSEDDENEAGEDTETEEDEETEKEKGVTKQTQTYTFIDNEGEEYQITVRTETKTREGETFEKIKVRDVQVVGAEGELIKVKLSNGNNQDVKIMPETASQTAIDKLQSRDVNVELKEVGEGNNIRAVYHADTEKQVKFLGMFRVRAQLTAMINAETGEVEEFDTPWWYFLAFGKSDLPEPECEVAEDCSVSMEYSCDQNSSCLSTPIVDCIDNTCVTTNTTIECSICNLGCVEETGLCFELPNGNETENNSTE